jgi:hypothetical protein
VQVVAVEAPVEGLGGGVVALFKSEDAFGEGDQVVAVAVVGGEWFALQDGEVDLDCRP